MHAPYTPERKIELVPAKPNEADARLIMEWRNDPVSLEASFGQKPKVWEAFWEEFRSDYFLENCPHPLFARIDDSNAAFLRFRPLAVEDGDEPRATQCDISINIAPEFRGRGLAVPVLEQASKYLQAQGVYTVIAEVKSHNFASKKAFLKAGYAFRGVQSKKGVSVMVYQKNLSVTS